MNGWSCPKCNAVMAPHIPSCVNCVGARVGWTTVFFPPTFVYGPEQYPQKTAVWDHDHLYVNGVKVTDVRTT